MYAINDLIMYGGTGVCKVSDITIPDFVEEEEKRYYVLTPLYQSGVIYAPTDNKKVFMRPVISEEEANDLIDSIPDIHTEIYHSSSIQQLTKKYQSFIDSHSCKDLLFLSKSIRNKRDEATNRNKKLGQIDKKFMQKAENLLFGELAAALKIDREEVEKYIEGRLGKQ